MKQAAACALLLLAIAGCFSGFSDDDRQSDLRVRRGRFTSDVVLSGEIEASRGEFLNVPSLPSRQTAIKWLIDDGATVAAGDRIAELDNSALTADLETKRQTATQTVQELQQREAEWAADLEQKHLDVDTRRAAVEKAQLDAVVPREIISGRAWEERQNAVRRASVEYEKAVDVLAARRTAIEAERKNLLLRIEKAHREITIAEEALAALVLHAPRGGIVVVRDHAWEGRRLQIGDLVWVGFPIAMLPDLGSLRVKASLADVDDGKIAAGMPVTVTLDGYPSMSFSGRVASISAVAQESGRMSLRRSFDVIVNLDRLDRNRMRPGLSARAVVHRAARDGVLVAPRTALELGADVARIRLAGGASKEVRVGECNPQECIILSGVDEGTRLAPALEVDRG